MSIESKGRVCTPGGERAHGLRHCVTDRNELSDIMLTAGRRPRKSKQIQELVKQAHRGVPPPEVHTPRVLRGQRDVGPSVVLRHGPRHRLTGKRRGALSSPPSRAAQRTLPP